MATCIRIKYKTPEFWWKHKVQVKKYFAHYFKDKNTLKEELVEKKLEYAL